MKLRCQEIGNKAKIVILANGGKIERIDTYSTVRHGELTNWDVSVDGEYEDSEGTLFRLPCGCLIGISKGDPYYPGSVGRKEACELHTTIF